MLAQCLKHIGTIQPTKDFKITQSARTPRNKRYKVFINNHRARLPGPFATSEKHYIFA